MVILLLKRLAFTDTVGADKRAWVEKIQLSHVKADQAIATHRHITGATRQSRRGLEVCSQKICTLQD